jgi:cytochrome P450
LFHVFTNPIIYKQLQAEIDSGITDGRISSPITDAEARKLPLLQACIKEGFRIWPPITGIMPRISKQDAVICGVRIPAGTNVAWSAWAVLRNKAMFGEDADMYRPDRWLLADQEKFTAMDNTVDLCFGQGRWGCLGRPIALIELNKMVVEVRTSCAL